jgi:hypothetical protein
MRADRRRDLTIAMLYTMSYLFGGLRSTVSPTEEFRGADQRRGGTIRDE